MTWTVHIENVAGIRAGEATLEPGLDVVRGTNWQGKSSFIVAIEAALGTRHVLTEGAATGRVDLETPDRTVHIELARENGAVTSRGEPLLTDEYDRVRASLFACLGEDNAVRAAVRNGENLEAVLTRPLEFENIEERLASLTEERSRVEAALDGAEEAANRLPKVETRIADLEATIEELRADLPAEDESEPGPGHEALSEARTERNRVRSRVERLESGIERAEATLEERREERADLEVPDPEDEPPDPAAAREELASLRRDVELVQSVFSANRLVLEEERLDLLGELDREISGETVTCWVCGSAVDRDHLEEHVGSLGDQLGTLRAQAERVSERVEELEARLEGREQAERRQQALDEEIAELEATLEEDRERLADARERLTALEARVEELSAEVQESVETVAELESEIRFREAELEEARDERETLESRADREDQLRAQRDELAEEIEALRGRKDELEQRARRAFDDALDDVLERFDTGFESARLTASFDLVVARDGREASLEALSEGELELLGFVTALAGHEAFEVGACVPVLLVDGLGSLADENRRRLVEYLADRVDYLVFTAHPEDSAVEAHEIDPSGWTVVSDRGAPED
ncbi:MAG: archaea-specific SMC-related protein [Halobacteriales archaeon]|nr:archaea-specific SMC-related protein [Halobacteriales archaeon]